MIFGLSPFCALKIELSSSEQGSWTQKKKGSNSIIIGRKWREERKKNPRLSGLRPRWGEMSFNQSFYETWSVTLSPEWIVGWSQTFLVSRRKEKLSEMKGNFIAPTRPLSSHSAYAFSSVYTSHFNYPLLVNNWCESSLEYIKVRSTSYLRSEKKRTPTD